MSFFKDFKEDLSQAVNELIPEEAPMEMEEPEMVDTLTEDDLELAEKEETPNVLESLLNGLEEIPVSEDVTAEEPEKTEEEAVRETEPEPVVTEDVEEEIIPEMPEAEELIMEEPVVEEPATEEPVMEEPVMEEAPVEETEIPKEEKVAETMSKEQSTLQYDGPATDENSIITEGMTVNGDISSRGSMEVLGCIIGNIELKGKLDISGVINGNSKAAEIFADSAKITGEVVSEGPVKVGQSSVIVGNITAKSAVIAGAVKGNIDVQGPVILDTSAIVMGDIKSKSVQINNGAVIEGHCSQCYAEVSPTSFFDDVK